MKGEKVYDELTRKCLAHSYDVHDIAVAGIFAITLGFRPLKKPFHPCILYIADAALWNVLACFIISLETVSLPRTCKTVLIQSSGVVIAAHVAPLKPPLMQWMNGLYSFDGFINFVADSYIAKLKAAKGMFITSVVG